MQNAKKKAFPMWKVLLVQALIVSIIIGLMFVLKKLSPQDYESVSIRYADVMENERSEASVKKAWNKVKAFFVDENDRPVQENVGGKDEDAEGHLYPENCSASKYIISEDICRPAQGKISSGFGYRINPVTQKLSFHTGIDIAADKSSAVKAAYYGIVEQAGEDDVYGKYIKLNHGNSIYTFYAHCSKLCVKVGDVVGAGDTIAKVGSTGWSTGPHLHFSIIINGIYCNPAYVVK